MLAPRLQRKVSWLAMLAMALLLVMPTAGRLLAGWSGGALGADIQLSPAHVMSHDGMSDRAMQHGETNQGMHHGDGICPYCPLLSSVMVLLLCLLLAAHDSRRRSAAPWRSCRLPFLLPQGLGARGPPLPL